MSPLLPTLTHHLTTTLATASDIATDLASITKLYKTGMFGSTTNARVLEDLQKFDAPELAGTVKFISETVTAGNKITSAEFLTLPDDSTLKYVYVISEVYANMFEKAPKDNIGVAAACLAQSNPRYEMVDAYYNMLMTAAGNKNQPFDMSAVDLDLDAYNLKDDTERGILFLQTMDLCGSVIFGYMHIVNPPNYKEAMAYISKFPKFNGQEYFRYDEFSFPDFEMVIERDKGAGSYKSFYLTMCCFHIFFA